MNGYNFTERVRKVLALARENAMRLHHEYLGPEHILLGLIREGEGVAAAVLRTLSVDLDAVQLKIEETVRKGKAGQSTGPDLPYTTRAKKVLEFAMTEARELNHSYVGTEHLLLALLREKGTAAQVLFDSGLELDQGRAAVLRLLGTDDVQASVRLEPRSEHTHGYNATERLRVVIAFAQEEAFHLRHDRVGTEHLLLGLIREGGGVANAALHYLGVEPEAIRATVRRTIRMGNPEAPRTPSLPYTAKARNALEYARTEARDLAHAFVGPEHLLLGLLNEEKGIAREVLTECGVTLEAARREILRLLGPPPSLIEPETGGTRENLRATSIRVRVDWEDAGWFEQNFRSADAAIDFLKTLRSPSAGG